MKIIHPIYIITLIIIGLSTPFFIYIYLSSGHPIKPLNITIIGSVIETSLVTYYLKKLPLSHLITINLIRNYNVSKPTNITMDDRFITFCGVQKSLMEMLQDFQMQYMIKPYGIYYHHNKSIKGLKESSMMSVIWEYGLSHYTAQQLFERFSKHLSSIDPTKFRENTLLGLVSKLIPDQPESSGKYYLSEVVGLDQLYMSDFINPIIAASYMNDVNSLSTMFKLQPLYCKKSLILLLNEKKFEEKTLSYNQGKINIFEKAKSYRKLPKQKPQRQRNQIQITLDNNTKILTNVIVIVEEYQKLGIKPVTQHISLVDGTMAHDQNYPQFYTMYLSDKLVRSITRICAYQCNNYRNSLYLVVSQNKITQSDLGMFQRHQIIKQKKKITPRTSLPNMKFQQTQEVYRVHETDTVSDNFQFKLSVFRNLVNIISDKYLT